MDESVPTTPPQVTPSISGHSAIIPSGQNPRALRQLARMVGLFGLRGWPEIAVEQDDGSVTHRPLPKQAADKVLYCRKLLNEYGMEPITE